MTKPNRSRRKTTLGPNEQAILISIRDLGEAAAPQIQRHIKAKTGVLLPPGTVYTTLHRLEDRFFVDPTQRSRGPTAETTYYEMSAQGVFALTASLSFIDKLRDRERKEP